MPLGARKTIASLALALAPQALASGEVSLSMEDLEIGRSESYVYVCETSQRQTAEKFGGNDAFVHYTLGFDLTVSRVSEEYVDLELVFTRIGVDSHLGVFDSNEPEETDENNLVAEALRPIIGEPFNVRLDAEREVLGVTAPSLAPVPDMMHSLYRRMFGDAYLSEALQPIFRIRAAPASASPGDEWTRVLERRVSVGRMDIVIEHRLQSVENGTAIVPITGEHRLRDQQTTPVSQRITEQIVKGRAEWSTSLDRLESLELHKSFVVEAGDENLLFRVTVIEHEEIRVGR